MARIEVENLSIALGEGEDRRPILQDVSFAVADGEVFGLVGESGSGKSTVLRCIAGLYAHWSGSIAIDGRRLGAGSRIERARQVQMVFQDPYGSLHPRQTVNTILMEAVRIHRLTDGERRIVQALTRVGLPAAFRYRFPHQLSGGQRQRVAIARCLMLEPEVLLLDEPTSALDVSVQAEILNLLKDLQSGGLTYVLVSHDLAVIGHMCRRFAVMRQGAILETSDTNVLSDPAALSDPYSRLLVEASEHYDRALAARM